MQESKYINEIYEKFYSNPLCKIVHTENPVEAFLLVTEQFLQYVNNIISEMEYKNKEKDLVFSVAEKNTVERKRFYMDLHEILTREVNLVLSSLMFYDFPKYIVKIEGEIDEGEIEAAYNHFTNVQLNDILNYAVDSWKLGGRTVEKNENKISFNLKGEIDESYFIINERNDSKANKVYLTIAQIIREVGERFPKGKDISAYFNIDEFITCYFLMEYFNTDHLESCFYSTSGSDSNNVSIRELVRAYFVLIMKCKEKIDNQVEFTNKLVNWGLPLDKQEIIDYFVKNGISAQNSNTIIEHLTYRRGVDIFDAPLMEINQQYLLLPSLLINIDVVKLVLSLVTEIDTRGFLFEDEIKNKICTSGIKCESLYIKEDEEYQCDLAMVIANDIYYCECKAWNEFKNINGYYNMLLKMEEAKVQLDRIANKFIKKVDYVNEKFGFHKFHKFKGFHKLVITLNMQGLQRRIGDTYFIDISCLVKFLDREKPGIRMYGKKKDFMEFKGYEEYEGTINNFKFMTMVKNPSNIELTRKNEQIGVNVFRLGDLDIEIPMYIPKNQSMRLVR